MNKPSQPETKIIEQFLKSTLTSAGKKRGVIAVSGGIDSAVSCTLLTQALGVEAVFPVLLPYGDQSIVDSVVLLDWLQIPESNRRVIDIKPVVEELKKTLGLNSEILDPRLLRGRQVRNDEERGRDDGIGGEVQHDVDKLRLGNLMARTRMTLLYDVARELDALVCGTENKSEKYLGYFTRFGDEASDIEPIQHLYKTQIFELARELQIPTQIIKKAPSAGLWQNQTDETELGFSYVLADQVLKIIVDQRPEMLAELLAPRNKSEGERKQIVAKIAEQVCMQIDKLQSNDCYKSGNRLGKGDGLDRRSTDFILESDIAPVLNRVQANWFKQAVPYQITNPH